MEGILSYRVLDHTGDILLEVRGGDLGELFAEGARALFDCILESGRVEPRKSRHLSLTAPSVEMLFREWMSELNYWHQVEAWLFSSFAIGPVSDTRLEAEAWGEPIDAEKHRIRREIKAVTYHSLSVTVSASGYTGTVLLDI
jgi:SHS2 domain-containing protein